MIRDVAAMNASLDNDYGATRGPNSPSSHQLALFAGDPAQDGAEITGGGYARVTVPASAWAAAADGSKQLTTAAIFPVPTGAWSNTATYWALISGGTMWDYAPIDAPITVASAGTLTPGNGPAVQVTIFYDDTLNTE